MPKIVTRLFDFYSEALHAMTELEAAGISAHEISLITTSDDPKIPPDGAEEDPVGADAGRGAVAGGAVGGIGGLLAGLGMMVIPGLGPVVAAGWLASAAVGAAVGAVAGGALGGLVGALVKAGEPEEDANVYAEAVRRGGTLVCARVHDDQYGLVASLLDHLNAITAERRGAVYREQGWKRFDKAAPLLGADDARHERLHYW